MSLDRLKFLVLDDNFHMLNIITTVLRGFGAKHFIETTDPTDALRVLQTHAIDVVIVDYKLDILDGLDFVRLARTGSDCLNPYVPIIMLTAHTERRRVLAARDAGVTEFCAKPVTAAEMARKIEAVIHKPRPFVKSGAYVGPDRRRRRSGYEGPDRRGAGSAARPAGAWNEAAEAQQWSDAGAGTAVAEAESSARTEADEAADWAAAAAN